MQADRREDLHRLLWQPVGGGPQREHEEGGVLQDSAGRVLQDVRGRWAQIWC